MHPDDLKSSRDSGPYWNVDIRNFGRVSRASIEMAPLVVLLGRNNTGKSYVASLLWSLLNFEELYLGRVSGPDIRPPDWYARLMRDEEITVPEEVVVDNDSVAEWANGIIASKVDDVVQRLLAVRTASVGSVTLSVKSNAPEVRITREPPEGGSSASMTARLMVDAQGNRLFLNYQLISSPVSQMFLNRTFGWVYNSVMSGNFDDGSATYLPAARTGLMLALRPLLSSALQSLSFDDKRSSSRLPLTTVKFLQKLTEDAGDELDSDSGQIKSAEFLEASVLKGQILRDDDAADPNFTYSVEGRDALPLHAASSMVTELAPFLLFLRQGSLQKGLVFEEPEAHLHLAAQRSMARVIARLVNDGIPVVITTHSDTFVQELNILMQVKHSASRIVLQERYGYADEELLDCAQIKAYEFVSSDSGTFTVEAKISEYGIVAESLNETLEGIASEVIDVQSAGDQSDD